MSRSSLLLLFGLLTVVAPFLGLPSSWVNILLAIFGLTVFGIGFSIRTEQVRKSRATTPTAEAAPAHEAMSAAPHGVSPI